MAVYRSTYQHPRQGPKVATLEPVGGGATINADAVISSRSGTLGMTSVSKPATAQIAAKSSQVGQSSVSRPSATQIIASSRQAGLAGIDRGASSRISVRSATMGSTIVSRLTQASISVRSSLSGMTVVARQATTFFRLLSGLVVGLFTPSEPLAIDDRTFAARWEDDRIIDGAGWIDDRTFAASWEDDRTIDGASWEDDRIIDGAGWEDDRTFPLPSIGMTKTGVKLDPIVIGDNVRVRRTYTTLPTGVLIEKAWLTVKKSESDLDAAALFQKDVTATATAKGQITDADTTGGDLAMFFEILEADTQSASSNQPYHYDVQVKRAGESKVHTLEKGTITFIRGVTSANS